MPWIKATNTHVSSHCFHAWGLRDSQGFNPAGFSSGPHGPPASSSGFLADQFPWIGCRTEAHCSSPLHSPFTAGLFAASWPKCLCQEGAAFTRSGQAHPRCRAPFGFGTSMTSAKSLDLCHKRDIHMHLGQVVLKISKRHKADTLMLIRSAQCSGCTGKGCLQTGMARGGWGRHTDRCRWTGGVVLGEN